jgi:hypothetical protein
MILAREGGASQLKMPNNHASLPINTKIITKRGIS